MKESKSLAVVEGAKPEAKKKKGDRDQLVLQIPTQLKELLGTKAQGENVSMNVFAMRAIATAVGFDLSTLPVREARARRKYANEEEKKAALKAAAEERRLLIKNLLAEHRAKVKAAAQAAPTA